MIEEKPPGLRYDFKKHGYCQKLLNCFGVESGLRLQIFF